MLRYRVREILASLVLFSPSTVIATTVPVEINLATVNFITDSVNIRVNSLVDDFSITDTTFLDERQFRIDRENYSARIPLIEFRVALDPITVRAGDEIVLGFAENSVDPARSPGIALFPGITQPATMRITLEGQASLPIWRVDTQFSIVQTDLNGVTDISFGADTGFGYRSFNRIFGGDGSYQPLPLGFFEFNEPVFIDALSIVADFNASEILPPLISGESGNPDAEIELTSVFFQLAGGAISFEDLAGAPRLFIADEPIFVSRQVIIGEIPLSSSLSFFVIMIAGLVAVSQKIK